MAELPIQQKRWVGGISDYPKETANNQIRDSYYWSRAINFRDDPSALTLLPASLKESGNTVTDLIKFGDIVPSSLESYFIGDTGNIYKRTTAGSWSNLHTAPQSHGNGLAYFSGDDYVYYTQDSSFGRYGPISGSPQFTDNYLKSQGGVPQNTSSVTFASASSMYDSAADSASLSITSDLTIEAYFKMTSLPTTGNSMALVAKWEETGNKRSYILDLYGVSGYFGSGSDGAKTVSSNTTDAPIDSACTGTSGTQTLTATNASFAVGQVILIHQTQGTNAGQWERNTIQGYTAGTITTGTALRNTYTTGAQVLVLKQYSSVTVNVGITWTAKAWNGTVGGILAYLCSGTVTMNGTQSANGKGFRGGAASTSRDNSYGSSGYQGESSVGTGSKSAYANGNGGGSGTHNNTATGSAGAGGGGGNGTGGQNGSAGTQGSLGAGGATAGSADLTTAVFGGGGGGAGGGFNYPSDQGGDGGSGGGWNFITGVTLTIGASGAITANGSTGSTGSGDGSDGGSGAGGSNLLKFQTATLGTNQVTASGGAASAGTRPGGSGGDGRNHADYLTSYTGTTSPTLNAVQDNTLVTTTTIQARLGISNDGTNYEYLTQNLTSLTVSTWNRLSVTWKASTSTAIFYYNAVAIGTSVGTKTAISDNTSLLYIAADKTTVIANYLDGKMDDVRIWSNVQTAAQIFANNNTQVSSTAAGLVAYYKFNGNHTDATGVNNLTAHNTPTFSSDVPFSDPTTRLDIDTSQNLTGDTYALAAAISEASVDSLSFTPVNDPQASIGFYVDTKGTGDWTVTIHDEQNRVIATATIANASIPASGFIEFIFTTPWRIIYNKTYHAHLTSTVADGKIVSGTNNDIRTAKYATYFAFLVTDTQFHPIVQFQYQPLGGVLTGAMIIGNERYLAVWDGNTYSPNFITFPPGWRVRCFAFWREFLAIAVWKGGNIYDLDRGKIYFWDGIAQTFNFSIDVPEGQINAMFGVDSTLYFFAGYRGNLLSYQGGYFYTTGNSESNKLKRMPLISQGDYCEVYPSALTMWRGMLHFGLFANSNSTTMERGVYSYGTLNQYYPDALSYDYVISTGNRSSSVSIGLVMGVGTKLLTAWRDGSGYGVDQIDFLNNPPASSGEIQVLFRDDGSIVNDKANFQVRADMLPLNTGESIDCKIKIDRNTDWTVSSVKDDVDSTFVKLPVGKGRGREYQFGADLYATGDTSPTLIGLSLAHDPLPDETQF